MKLLKLFILAALAMALQANAQNSNRQEQVNNYIKKYKSVAIREQKRVGIPAAITLAQGIHETNAGASELAVNANNHFGIKCKKEWKGQTYTYTDDRPNECFRKYNSDLESYKDHSDYLSTSPRYAALFKLSLTDYAGWAYGLKRCGYATNPKYATLLIKIIEDNHLQEYTYAALNDDYNPTREVQTGDMATAVDQPETIANTPSQPAETLTASALQAGEVIPETDTPTTAKKEITPTPPVTTTSDRMIVNDGTHRYTVIKNNEKPNYGQTIMVNGLKAFYAQKGKSLLDEAINFGVRYSKLLELNDLPDEPLEADMFIYLEKKNTKGSSMYHVVKPGETLLQIAQVEGVQLKSLRQLNKIREDEEPVGGTLLHLQQTVDHKPDVIVKREKIEDIKFAGSDTKAVPQGATRMRSDYISKQEIETTTNNTTTKIAKEEKRETTPEPQPTKNVSTEAVKEVAPATEKPAPATEVKAVVVEEKPIDKTVSEEEDIIVKTAETTTQKTEEKAETTTDKITAATQEAIKTPTPHTEPAAVETPTVGITKIDSTITAKEETPINIADTKAVEEEVKTPEPVKEEEPKDEYARLKARLDKVVYAGENAAKEVKETPTVTEKKTPSATASAPSEATTKPVYYTVKKGDNAFGIAKKHNITMAQLKAWNQLDFSEIKVGQKLRVK